MTEISSTILGSVCRLCLSENVSEKHSIFGISEETQISIADQIWRGLQIKVEKDDSLPNFICSECFNTTQKLLSFIQQCHDSQKKLQQLTEVNKILPQIKSDHENMKVDEVENKCSKVKEEPSDSTIEETEDPSEMLSTDNDDSEEPEVLPDLGEPSPEDYVLMKEETFSIDANKVSSANRGKTGILGDHLVEFNNNSDLRDRDVVEIQRIRQELLPPMWDVYEKSTPNESGELQVTHRRYIVSKGAFPCSLCGACFRFDQACERGEAPDTGPFDCVICHKVFPKRSAWKKTPSNT